jgi:hypothetical protein
VVEAEQMKNGCVQVVDVDLVIGDVKAVTLQPYAVDLR